MVEIRIYDPTPPKVGEVTDSKENKRNTSPLNREVGFHGGDLTARIVIVKVKALVLLHMKGGPSKI